MAKYLDDNGLSYLWQKIKAHVNTAISAIGKVPTGGSAGQILAKASNTDYDTEWITNSGGSGSYLPLSGGTLTGNLNVKHSNIDAKLANNGISANTWPQDICGLDKNDAKTSFFGEAIYTGGDIAAGVWAYNYDTSGNQVSSNSLTVIAKKDGTKSYGVSDQAAFRTAIGVSYSNATSLYDNSSGTTGTVTLSQSAANFSILEIFFCDIDGNYSSVHVWSPNGKVVSLTTSAVVGTNLFFISWTRRVKINGTSIANQVVSNYSTGRFYIYATGTTGVQSDNYIKIVKVLGWKG